MKMSESIKNIAPAFAKAQAEMKDLFKDTKGYGYKYATLDAVLKEVRSKLAAVEMFFTQDITITEQEKIKIQTTVIHSSGEWLQYETSFPFARMKGMNDYQSAGSGFTYSRRYVLSAIFGIASDEDSDGAGEQIKKEPVKQQRKQRNKFEMDIIAWVKLDPEMHTSAVQWALEDWGYAKLADIPESEQADFKKKVQEAVK